MSQKPQARKPNRSSPQAVAFLKSLTNFQRQTLRHTDRAMLQCRERGETAIDKAKMGGLLQLLSTRNWPRLPDVVAEALLQLYSAHRFHQKDAPALQPGLVPLEAAERLRDWIEAVSDGTAEVSIGFKWGEFEIEPVAEMIDDELDEPDDEGFATGELESKSDDDEQFELSEADGDAARECRKSDLILADAWKALDRDRPIVVRPGSTKDAASMGALLPALRAALRHAADLIDAEDAARIIVLTRLITDKGDLSGECQLGGIPWWLRNTVREMFLRNPGTRARWFRLVRAALQVCAVDREEREEREKRDRAAGRKKPAPQQERCLELYESVVQIPEFSHLSPIEVWRKLDEEASGEDLPTKTDGAFRRNVDRAKEKRDGKVEGKKKRPRSTRSIIPANDIDRPRGV